MNDRAEFPPCFPVSTDVEGALSSEVVEEARDARQLRDLDLTPVLDLLSRVDSAELSTGLVEQERERVEEWRCGRRVDAVIRDAREEAPHLGLESGLLLRLAHESIEDRFA